MFAWGLTDSHRHPDQPEVRIGSLGQSCLPRTWILFRLVAIGETFQPKNRKTNGRNPLGNPSVRTWKVLSFTLRTLTNDSLTQSEESWRRWKGVYPKTFTGETGQNRLAVPMRGLFLPREKRRPGMGGLIKRSSKHGVTIWTKPPSKI